MKVEDVFKTGKELFLFPADKIIGKKTKEAIKKFEKKENVYFKDLENYKVRSLFALQDIEQSFTVSGIGGYNCL